jgi:hypothetical protein
MTDSVGGVQVARGRRTSEVREKRRIKKKADK